MAPKEPRVKSCLDTTSQRQDDFLLICNENLSANDGRSPCICVCVCLGPRSWSAHGPTLHSSCVTVCLTCSASEFFMTKRREKEKDSDSVYLVSLLAISPVRKEAHQKQAFKPKLQNPIDSCSRLTSSCQSDEKLVMKVSLCAVVVNKHCILFKLKISKIKKFGKL